MELFYVSKGIKRVYNYEEYNIIIMYMLFQF